MLRLGTKVRLAGREALVVARTLAGVPRYDVRFGDGELAKYVFEAELEVVAAGDVLAPRAAAGREWQRAMAENG